MEVLVNFLLIISLAVLVILAGFFFLHFMMSIIITAEAIHQVKKMEEENGD